MAGSLNHIVNSKGKFTMEYIENLGDAEEALKECFHLIHDLAGGDKAKISAACRKRRYPDPFDPENHDEEE